MEYHQAMRILKAFRGHFTDQATDLEPTEAEGTLHCCFDRRLDEKADLNIPNGRMFLTAAAGAAIPSYQGGTGTDLQMVQSISFAFRYQPQADTIAIIGHTDCLANRLMIEALLTDQPLDANLETRWMLPMAANGLKEALKEAQQNGADENHIRRLVEQITILQSMRHLYDYEYDQVTVRDMVAEGRLQVVGAFRHLERDPLTGRRPLFVFDPEHKAFVDLDEIYIQAGQPSFEALERYSPHQPQAASPREPSVVPFPKAAAQPEKDLRAPGTSDEEVINLTIKELVRAIRQSGRPQQESESARTNGASR